MGNVARFKRIYIEITSSCNLKCSFCQETLRSPHFMSVDEFAHTLQQIRPYTNYIYLHVKGEPLLHPQLDEILALCRRAGDNRKSYNKRDTACAKTSHTACTASPSDECFPAQRRRQ